MASRVLVVAAHPDDEVLGCGGAMSRFKREGADVSVIILGEGITSRKELAGDPSQNTALDKLRRDSKDALLHLGVQDVTHFSLPDNSFDAIPLLDIVHLIEEKAKDFEPTIVLTHDAVDLNLDHVLVNRATCIAFRPLPSSPPPILLTFEVPSSTEWAPSVPFSPNWWMPLDAKDVSRKIEAMEKYQSERREAPHPRSPESLRSLACWRGSNVGQSFAEAFRMIRAVYGPGPVEVS